MSSSLVVLVLALLARASALPAALASPYLAHPILDAASYDAWAQRIAAGDWLGKGVFFQDPLYPYLLGSIYALVGHHPEWILVLQMAVGALTAVLVASIARRVFGEPAGLFAGILAALDRMNVFYEAALLKVCWTVLLLVLVVDLLLRARDGGRRGVLLASGLVLGLALQVRGHFFLLLPFLAAWILLFPQPHPGPGRDLEPGRHLAPGRHLGPGRRPGPWRRLGRGGLAGRAGRLWIFAAGVALALAPVTIRNAAVGGDVALTTSQWGTVFYLGNQPGNPWGIIESPPFIRTVPGHEEGDWRREAERRTGRSLRPNEVSRYWLGQSLRFIASAPIDEARILVRRALLFWNHYEVSDNLGIEDVERFVPALRVWLRPFAFGLIAPLAIGGLLFLRRRREGPGAGAAGAPAGAAPSSSPRRPAPPPEPSAKSPHPDGLRLLRWTLLALFLGVLLFPLSSRFRMPALPLLEIFAGAFLADLVAAAALPRRRSLLLRAVVLLAAAAAVAAPVYPYAVESRAHRHANLATALLNETDARERRPRIAEARAEAEAALRLHPSSPQVNRLLASILVAESDDAPPRERARMLAEAERRLTERAFVSGRDLRNAATYRVRAWIRYVEGRDAEAEADLRALLDLLPDDVESLVYLAAVTCNRRRCEEALSLLDRAASLDPASLHVHDTRCLILLRMGRMQEAWDAAQSFRRAGGRLSRPVREQLEAWRAEAAG